MPTFMHWVHLMAAVIALGALGFLLLILIPAVGVLSAQQRETLSKAVAVRFRWASWSAMALLLISGLYSIRRYYWEEPWDRAWEFLTLKIVLALALFAIILGLSIPLRLFEPLRARRSTLVLAAFLLGVVVVLISAYLRRG
jgi:uncharacterized membrane protein